MKLLFRAHCAIFVLLLLTACSDDGEVTPPLLQLYEPTEGSMLQAGHSFQLSGSVSDEQGLEAVVVNLLGGSGETAWFVTGHSSENLNNHPRVYILDELLSVPDTASAGTYTLQLNARDLEGTELEENISLILHR